MRLLDKGDKDYNYRVLETADFSTLAKQIDRLKEKGLSSDAQGRPNRFIFYPALMELVHGLYSPEGMGEAVLDVAWSAGADRYELFFEEVEGDGNKKFIFTARSKMGPITKADPRYKEFKKIQIIQNVLARQMIADTPEKLRHLWRK